MYEGIDGRVAATVRFIVRRENASTAGCSSMKWVCRPHARWFLNLRSTGRRVPSVSLTSLLRTFFGSSFRQMGCKATARCAESSTLHDLLLRLSKADLSSSDAPPGLQERVTGATRPDCSCRRSKRRTRSERQCKAGCQWPSHRRSQHARSTPAGVV